MVSPFIILHMVGGVTEVFLIFPEKCFPPCSTPRPYLSMISAWVKFSESRLSLVPCAIPCKLWRRWGYRKSNAGIGENDNAFEHFRASPLFLDIVVLFFHSNRVRRKPKTSRRWGRDRPRQSFSIFLFHICAFSCSCLVFCWSSLLVLSIYRQIVEVDRAWASLGQGSRPRKSHGWQGGGGGVVSP